MAAGIKARIQTLQHDVKTFTEQELLFPERTSHLVQFNLRIHQLAQEILQTPQSEEKKCKRLDTLMQARTHLISHCEYTSTTRAHFQTGKNPTSMFLNSVQPIYPAPLSPGHMFLGMSVPQTSTYHDIHTVCAAIKCDPSALEHVPPEVLRVAGDLTGKEVEIFWVATDGRHPGYWHDPKRDHDLFNLSTQCWSFPHVQLGDDLETHVEMGIFPIYGIEPARDKDALKFGETALMRVHSHRRSKSETYLLYSPDNAHFRLEDKIPFALFWTILKNGRRVAISKMLVFREHPFTPLTTALWKSIQGNASLADHLQKLRTEVQPLARHIPYLENQLVTSQVALLEKSQTLVMSSSAEKMNECAHLFLEGENAGAQALFETFSPQEKEAVYFAAWMICGSPRQDSVGENLFHSPDRISNLMSLFEHWNQFQNPWLTNKFWNDRNPFDPEFKQMKAHALLLAASRLTQKTSPANLYLPFLQLIHSPELIALPPAEKAVKVNTLLASLTQKERNTIHYQVYKRTPGPKEGDNWGARHVADDLNVLRAAFEHLLLAAYKPSAASSSSPKSSPGELDLPFLHLIHSPEFIALPPTERAVQVNALLASLTQKERDTIYFQVYRRTSGPKEGENWGSRHVADDLNVLRAAFEHLLLSSKPSIMQVHSTGDLFSAFTKLITSQEFVDLPNERRAEQMNALLSTLPRESINTIRYEVFKNTPGPKQGSNWGELHIADDLVILRRAYERAMGAIYEPEIPSSPASASSSSHQEVDLYTLIEGFEFLVHSETFIALPAKTRSEQMNALFSALPKKARDMIHYEVYKRSPGLKEGKNWGEFHVADDLELLKSVYAFVLDRYEA